METLKIVKGQPFVLWVPTIMLNADGKQAIDASTLTNVAVTAGNGCKKIDIACQPFEHWLVLQFGGDLEVGPYNIRIDGRLESNREFSLALSKAVEIVNWDKESNWDRFIIGDHIELTEHPFITGTFLTDEEYAELKEELRHAIAEAEAAKAEAEQAKEEFIEKAEQMNDVAKETTAQAAASDAAAAKVAAQAITGYALQGSDATATNTAILQAIPSVAGLATESNATANKNEVLAAIAANAGIPTLTIPDSTASQELAPNTLYIFASRTSTLTLTLGTPIVGIANEYHFFVVCGSTAPTINFPAGITWNGGSAPTIAADKTYEVSILNNVAAYFEV